MLLILAKINLICFSLYKMVFSSIEIDPELIHSFHFAVQFGDVGTVERFIQDGMPVNVSGVDGWTALHLAAFGNRSDFVKRLLQAGADINKQDESGNTALHKAARNNYNDIVELLLAQGADINLENRDNETPLDSHTANKLLKEHQVLHKDRLI